MVCYCGIYYERKKRVVGLIIDLDWLGADQEHGLRGRGFLKEAEHTLATWVTPTSDDTSPSLGTSGQVCLALGQATLSLGGLSGGCSPSIPLAHWPWGWVVCPLRPSLPPPDIPSLLHKSTQLRISMYGA